MSKSPRHLSAGNVNLKGKKSHRMGCGCCVCYDLREENLNKIVSKEIKEAIADVAQG